MTSEARDLAKVRNAVLLTAAAAWLWLIAMPHGVAMAGMIFPRDLALDWAVMLVATMLPTLIPPLCHIRRQSFTHRRTRSVALFLTGYGAVWMAAGAVLTGLALTVQSIASPRTAAACILAAALLWQITPAKQKCLNRCHAHPPLAAFGHAADLSALRFGAVHGAWCVASCWAWMLFPMLLPRGQLPAMFAVGVLIFCERLEQPARPGWKLRGLGRATRLLAAQARTRPPSRDSLA